MGSWGYYSIDAVFMSMVQMFFQSGCQGLYSLPSKMSAIRSQACLVGDGLLQGDANNTAQKVELDRTNYVGREAFSLPWLGDAVSAVLSVKWVVFVVAGVLVISACIPARKEIAA